MNKIKDKVNINLDQLPKTIKHGQECFDYDKFVGLKVDFSYKELKEFFIIEKVIRIKSSYSIIINYNGGLYKTNVDNFKNGNFYKGILRYCYKYNIGDIVGDYKIIERKCEPIKCPSQTIYPRQYYCECIKCGYKSWKFEDTLGNNKQCTVCGKNPKNVVEGINDIPTTAPWMIPYFQGGYEEAKQYTYASSKRIIPICPYCNTIKDKSIKISNIYTYHGISCNCMDTMSYPNKLMYNILRIKNIKFISEYSPDWIKPKRYDFYIPSKNIIIEMDGGWHYIDNNLSGKSKDETRKIDNFKEKEAYKHSIITYRIDCRESNCDYIYNNILESGLNKILQISYSELNDADSKSHNNLIKEVCEYKNIHDNMTSSTIAKHFNLSRDTIQVYIKIGVKHGWCKSFKTYSRYKCILLAKDGVDIGIFKGYQKLILYLNKKYNTNMSTEEIRKIMNTNKTYDGFSFKDLDKEQSDYFLQSDSNWDCMLFQNDIMNNLKEKYNGLVS